MEEKILSEKLIRQMSSGDYCHQRIFKCLPLLNPLVNCYMIDNKQYVYPVALLEIIKEWNTQRLEEISLDTIHEAIFDIMTFDETIHNLYEEYLQNGKISFSQDIISSLDLVNYKQIVSQCNLLNEHEKFNASKILHRAKTFKTKLLKVFKGTITLESFMQNEVIPQKKFLDTFISHMKLFRTNQFLIFILCYDIKHIKY